MARDDTTMQVVADSDLTFKGQRCHMLWRCCEKDWCIQALIWKMLQAPAVLSLCTQLCQNNVDVHQLANSKALLGNLRQVCMNDGTIAPEMAELLSHAKNTCMMNCDSTY